MDSTPLVSESTLEELSPTLFRSLCVWGGGGEWCVGGIGCVCVGVGVHVTITMNVETSKICILVYMVWLHQTIQNLTKPETWNVENEGRAFLDSCHH